MKKLLVIIIILIIAPSCFADKIEIGVMGGMLGSSYEDQGLGSIYGLKAKYIPYNFLMIQAGFGYGKFGSAEFSFGTREGSSILYYNIDYQIGFGFLKEGCIRSYIILGGTGFQIRRRYDLDVNDDRFNIGLGMEYPFSSKLAVEIEGKILTAEGYEEKIRILSLGINYIIK